MSQPVKKYSTPEMMQQLNQLWGLENDMMHEKVFGNSSEYSDKDFLNVTIMHLMDSPDSADIDGQAFPLKRIGENLRDMYSEYEAYEPGLFYAGVGQPAGSLFFNLVGRAPEVGVNTFDAGVLNPLYNLNMILEDAVTTNPTNPSQADLWNSIQYPHLKSTKHPFATIIESQTDGDPNSKWNRSKKWFGLGEAQYQAMDKYQMVRALKSGDRRYIDAIKDDLQLKVDKFSENNNLINAERYSNYIDYMDGKYGYPELSDFTDKTGNEKVNDLYSPYWKTGGGGDNIANQIHPIWQGVEYKEGEGRFTEEHFKYKETDFRGEKSFKPGLSDTGPLALFHNYQLNQRYNIAQTRDWIAEVWGDPVVDYYYSQPHLQQHMHWYENSSPADIALSTTWVKDFSAFLGSSLSSTIASVGVGGLTTIATKGNIKAGMNAAQATMYMLESSDQYEQGIQFWKSLDFEDSEARSMAAQEAVIYGIGSSAIERFGAWNIYASKLGPKAAAQLKRNIFVKMHNKLVSKSKQVNLALQKSSYGAVRKASGLSVRLAPYVGGAFAEAFQEEAQLAYQSLIQSGYSDKSWIDGFSDGWKEAGAGAALASVVMGKGSSILANQLDRKRFKSSSMKQVTTALADKGASKVEGEELINNAVNTMFGVEDINIESEEGSTNSTAGEVKSWGQYAGQLEAQYLTKSTYNEDYVDNILKKKDKNSYSDLDLVIEQGSRYDSQISKKLYDVYQRTGDAKFLEYNEETGEGIKDRAVRDKFKSFLALEIKADKKNQIVKQLVHKEKRSMDSVEDIVSQIGSDEAGLINAINAGNENAWFDSKLEEQGEAKFIEAQSKRREGRLEQKRVVDEAKATGQDIDPAAQQEAAFEKSLEQDDINNNIDSNPQQEIDKLKRDAPNVRAQKLLSLNNTNLVKLAKAIGIPVPESKTLPSMNGLRDAVSVALNQGSTNKVDKKTIKKPAIQDKVFEESKAEKEKAKDEDEALYGDRDLDEKYDKDIVEKLAKKRVADITVEELVQLSRVSPEMYAKARKMDNISDEMHKKVSEFILDKGKPDIFEEDATNQLFTDIIKKPVELDSGKEARFEDMMKQFEGTIEDFADTTPSNTDTISETQQKEIDENVEKDSEKLEDDLCL